MFAPGQVVVVHGPRFLRFGVYVDPGHVVHQKTRDDTIDIHSYEILRSSLSAFAQGCAITAFNYGLPRYDLALAYHRAQSQVGRKDNIIVTKYGDTFTHWCVFGVPPMPDSDIFGQHLVVRRPQGHEHHGIGIERNHVVHFNYPKGTSSHLVHMASLEEFAAGDAIRTVLYAPRKYPHPIVRNRALNCLGIKDYNLIEMNCEHIATWCITGEARSLQIEAIDAALTKTLAVVGMTVVGLGLATLFAPDANAGT